MPPPIPRTAAQVVRNFRTRELEGLMSHLRLYGPLPPPSDLDSKPKPSIILPNPFIPMKNPKTGRWREPKYSLRRQADLVKKAHATGNLSMMPPGPKTSAFELRLKRVKAALPASATVVQAEPASTPETTELETANTKKPTWEERHVARLAKLQGQINASEEKIEALEAELAPKRSQHDIDQLAAFERKKEAASQRRQREASFSALEEQIHTARLDIFRAEQELSAVEEEAHVRDTEQAEATLWKNPLWVGEVKEVKTKGAELGTRLYAGKKKMFKGHLWERQRAKRVRRQSILMRDMAARVARYKTFYKKRKPNPLKPSRYTKPPKLPF